MIVEYIIQYIQNAAPSICLSCMLALLLIGVYIGYTISRRHERYIQVRERINLYKDVQDYTDRVCNGRCKKCLRSGDN